MMYLLAGPGCCSLMAGCCSGDSSSIPVVGRRSETVVVEEGEQTALDCGGWGRQVVLTIEDGAGNGETGMIASFQSRHEVGEIVDQFELLEHMKGEAFVLQPGVADGLLWAPTERTTRARSSRGGRRPPPRRTRSRRAITATGCRVLSVERSRAVEEAVETGQSTGGEPATSPSATSLASLWLMHPRLFLPSAVRPS